MKKDDVKIIQEMADTLHMLYDYISKLQSAEHRRTQLLDKIAEFKQEVKKLKEDK